MVYNSAIYLFLFFPLAFALSRLVTGRRGRSWLLAVLSILFYAFGGLAALPVLLLSVGVNYALGLLLARKRSGILLSAGVALNLGILSVYKYLGFFLSVVAPGVKNPIGVLPAGISFFTFQALAYLASRGITVTMKDEETCVTMLSPGTHHLHRSSNSAEGGCKPYRRFSLFAYSPACEGLSIRGAKYELDHGHLENTFPLGVSNEFSQDTIHLSFTEGMLLVIMNHQQ